jgi:hypothetical protein
MKTTAIALFCAILVISCKKDESTPVEPVQQPSPPARKVFVLSEHRFRLDSLFYKMWSDSVSQRYGGQFTWNGTTYQVLEEGPQLKYLFNRNGELAGQQSGGMTPVIYDWPMPKMPDTVAIGEMFRLSTQFIYPANQLTIPMVEEYTLLDTGSVQVPCGSFSSSAHFAVRYSSVYPTGQAYSIDYETWFVKDLANVKTLYSGQTNPLVVVRGCVRGRTWGM